MIVKVQVSLATSERQQQVLVYNEDRSFERMFPAEQSILELMEGRNEAYFRLESWGLGELCFDEEVPQQDW